MNKFWKQHPTKLQLYDHFLSKYDEQDMRDTAGKKQGRTHKWLSP